MKPISMLSVVLLLCMFGCGSPKSGVSNHETESFIASVESQPPATSPTSAQHPQSFAAASPRLGGGGGGRAVLAQRRLGGGGSSEQTVDQLNLVGANAAAQAMDRKIISNAELSIETDDPTDGQRKVTSIAESLGGFVVSSEFKQNVGGVQLKPSQTVTITARVPASRFPEALNEIRGVGGRVIQEKVSGQDVTEEFVDLEARIRTKKALEAQFLEIMKQARKVEDALEVQREIADVRTEIERLEGRRRFLQNQSELSTITVTLQPAAPIVTATTSGFGEDIKHASGEGVDVAASIVTGLIRLIIIMVPVTALILLPAALLTRFVFRRYRPFGWRRAEPESLRVT